MRTPYLMLSRTIFMIDGRTTTLKASHFILRIVVAFDDVKSRKSHNFLAGRLIRVDSPPGGGACSRGRPEKPRRDCTPGQLRPPRKIAGITLPMCRDLPKSAISSSRASTAGLGPQEFGGRVTQNQELPGSLPTGGSLREQGCTLKGGGQSFLFLVNLPR